MIEKLTAEQEAALVKYRNKGIQIGLAVGAEFDEAEVRLLTDKHRVQCGVPAVNRFVVYDSPFAACAAVSGLSGSNALFGQHDIHWLMYYQYMRMELGVTGLEGIQYLLELATRVGWMWMSSTTTIVTRRPVSIHMLEKMEGPAVLHNPNGLALEYADGTGVYASNGTRFPEELGRKFLDVPEKELDPAEVLAIQNTEIRSEVLKKISIDRVFERLPNKVLDRSELRGGTYVLREIRIEQLVRKYLQGSCPSNGEAFFEAVSPECTTVKQALAFRNYGDSQVEYVEPEVLT
jgi:hypothetical protein